MRRRLATGTVLAMAVVAVLASTASAKTMPVSGGVTQTSFVPSDFRTVGKVTFFSFTETDSLTGTFTGTSALTGECVTVLSGTTMCKADETFTSTATGASGTVQFKDLISIDPTGAFSGRFVIVGGTGDFANVHGHGTFSGTGRTGTYSGTLATGP
jgi:hypothetical protein